MNSPEIKQTNIRVISPQGSTSFLEALREIWRFRELFYFLAWRDYKVRYKETVIGVLWALLQPLLVMVVFVFLFGRTNTITDSVPYPLFAYSGLMVWFFFSNAVTSAASSFLNNNTLITKVYFPRIIVPLSTILVYCVDFAAACVILVALMLFWHIHMSPLIVLALPFVAIATALFASAVGLLLATVVVKFRDIKHIVPFFVQLSLFLSPIIYHSAALGGYQNLIALNPLTGIINGFRAVLFNNPFPINEISASLIVIVALLVISLLYFRSTEDSLSDTL